MNASRCLSLTAATVCCFLSVVDARFAVQGPVLTVTLKDPQLSASDSKWLDLASIRPNAVLSLQSTSKPLPNWLPSLQSLRANVGYHYEELKRLPSYVESDVKFSNTHGDMQIQPSYEFRSKKASLLLQGSRGASYLMGRLTTKGERWLEMVRGCYQLDLPYASVGGLRITPSFDFRRKEPACLLEATTGSQRTKALLNLEYDNPTLSVVHALDDRYVVTCSMCSVEKALIVFLALLTPLLSSCRTTAIRLPPRFLFTMQRLCIAGTLPWTRGRFVPRWIPLRQFM
jgi:hypothetical protein